MNRLLDLDSNAKPNHQAGQALTVDQDDTCRQVGDVIATALAKATRSDEDALVRLVAVKCTNERLDLWPSDCGINGVAFGLNVDPAQPERILVDDAVDIPPRLRLPQSAASQSRPSASLGPPEHP